LPAPAGETATTTANPAKTPPCKRCGARSGQIEEQPKARLRWIVETVFAAPDVWIFQSESAGWPRKSYQRWACDNCGRAVRVA